MAPVASVMFPIKTTRNRVWAQASLGHSAYSLDDGICSFFYRIVTAYPEADSCGGGGVKGALRGGRLRDRH